MVVDRVAIMHNSAQQKCNALLLLWSCSRTHITQAFSARPMRRHDKTAERTAEGKLSRQSYA